MWSNVGALVNFGGDGLGRTIDSRSVRLFKLALQHGDEVSVAKRVTDGDLSPHFTLFFGVATKISSDDFDVSTDELTKTYTVENNGTHVLVVQAFQNQGEGSFDLGDHDADKCIALAQDCAFEETRALDGAVRRHPRDFRAAVFALLDPSFAEDHEACGGHLEADSVLECEELCAATNGAWADDLSSACPGDVC